MRIDSVLVVITEWVAFVAWLFTYKKSVACKYKLLTGYLGAIAITELANLVFWKSDDSITNMIVMHFNVPLQFVFWFYFLLYNPHHVKSKMLFTAFTLVYLLFFIAERNNFFVAPVNYDSLSHGIGNLLLIVAIITSMFHFFKTGDIIKYNQTTFFWILLAIIIYYIGSFPYKNFRNFFWSKKEYYGTAYFLHYMSQTFNCIMYLLLAYSTKWKTR